MCCAHHQRRAEHCAPRHASRYGGFHRGHDDARCTHFTRAQLSKLLCGHVNGCGARTVLRRVLLEDSRWPCPLLVSDRVRLRPSRRPPSPIEPTRRGSTWTIAVSMRPCARSRGGLGGNSFHSQAYYRPSYKISQNFGTGSKLENLFDRPENGFQKCPRRDDLTTSDTQAGPLPG